MKGAAGAFLAVAAPGLAVAQPAPPPRAQPTRDVSVVYRVEGQAANLVPGGIPGPVRIAWDAAGHRLRVEPQGRTQVALIDLGAHTGQAIDTSLRIVLPLPIRPQDLQPLTLEGARLVPRGKETIAGLVCTAYQVETGHAPGTACLTADGVPLRGAGEIQGKPGSFVALSVSYGSLAPTLFTVPPGYISLGGVGGGSGGNASGLAGQLGDLRHLGAALLGRGQ